VLFSISTETAPFYAYLIHIHKIKNPRKVLLYRDLSINWSGETGLWTYSPISFKFNVLSICQSLRGTT